MAEKSARARLPFGGGGMKFPTKKQLSEEDVLEQLRECFVQAHNNENLLAEVLASTEQHIQRLRQSINAQIEANKS